MGEQDSLQAIAVRKAYAQAVQMKSEGVPGQVIRETIEKKLIAGGLNAAAASIIAANVPGVRAVSAGRDKSAQKNIIIGGSLIVGGVLLTFLADAGIVPKNVVYYGGVLGLIIGGIVFFGKMLFDHKSDA